MDVNRYCARLVELVDTRDLKSLDLKVVPVQVRQRAPIDLKFKLLRFAQFLHIEIICTRIECVTGPNEYGKQHY